MLIGYMLMRKPQFCFDLLYHNGKGRFDQVIIFLIQSGLILRDIWSVQSSGFCSLMILQIQTGSNLCDFQETEFCSRWSGLIWSVNKNKVLVDSDCFRSCSAAPQVAGGGVSCFLLREGNRTFIVQDSVCLRRIFRSHCFCGAFLSQEDRQTSGLSVSPGLKRPCFRVSIAANAWVLPWFRTRC